MHQDRHTSAPTSLIPSSRLCGNSPRRSAQLSSRRCNLQVANRAPARARSSARPAAGAGGFVRSRWRNELLLWGGNRNAARFARSSIVRSAGHGSVVMLWDGPGVGKTRLAMEMAEYASHTGFRCSVGHCYERDEPYPYIPFAEIIESNLAQAASLDDYRRQMGDNAAELAQIAPSLRRIFPDLPKPLGTAASAAAPLSFPKRLRRRWRARLKHGSQLYLLEDLHWADESTLALLIHLANRVAPTPGCNYRDLPRRIFRYQSGVGKDSGGADSDRCPSAQAERSVQKRRRADVTWAERARGPGEFGKPHF